MKKITVSEAEQKKRDDNKKERQRLADLKERREKQQAEHEEKLRAAFKLMGEMVDIGFRELSKKAHPDHGGSHDDQVVLNFTRALFKEMVSTAVEDDMFDYFMD